MTNLSFWQRSAILIGLLMVGLLALLALDPIPQDPNYHLFADNRSLFGIPHFNNVISNAGFAVVGIVGFLAFAGVAREVRSWEKPAITRRPGSNWRRSPQSGSGRKHRD